MKITLVSISLVVYILLGTVQGAINEFYPMYLNKYSCSGKYSWTKWFNVGKPINKTSGDSEDMSIILAQYPTMMCHVPFGIQAQSINYHGGNWSTGWRRQRVDATRTLLSFYSTEPGGVDFQVRYCCPTGTFISEISTTTTATPLDSTTCGKRQIKPKDKRKKRIYGGEEAFSNSWPWMIFYKEKNENDTHESTTVCGGTLISKDYVLTAAHCIGTKNGSYITLVAGMHSLESITELVVNALFDIRQERIVQKIYIHPEYDSSTLINDIALLRVNMPFKFTEYVQPACLPGGEPQPNDEVVIIGWGSTTENGSANNELKQAYTEVIDDCDQWWTEIDSSKQICVADAFNGTSACFGDSGGPILTQYQGQYVVSGVSSHSDKCNTKGRENSPNVYTRVAPYKTWIKSIIGH